MAIDSRILSTEEEILNYYKTKFPNGKIVNRTTGRAGRPCHDGSSFLFDQYATVTTKDGKVIPGWLMSPNPNTIGFRTPTDISFSFDKDGLAEYGDDVLTTYTYNGEPVFVKVAETGVSESEPKYIAREWPTPLPLIADVGKMVPYVHGKETISLSSMSLFGHSPTTSGLDSLKSSRNDVSDSVTQYTDEASRYYEKHRNRLFQELDISEDNYEAAQSLILKNYRGFDKNKSGDRVYCLRTTVEYIENIFSYYASTVTIANGLKDLKRF